MNKTNFPIYQLFIFMKVPNNMMPQMYNETMVNQLLQYFRSKHFPEFYLNEIKSTDKLYNRVKSDMDQTLNQLKKMTSTMTNKYSLNDFLTDIDIHNIMKNIYGDTVNIKNLNEKEMKFFFRDGDCTQFNNGM